MKKVICCFMFQLFIANVWASSYTLDNPFRINKFIPIGDIALADNTLIDRSIILINEGTINGAFTVKENVEIIVRNSGDLNASFSLEHSATLTQYISKVTEATRLNVTGGTYIPVIRDDFDGSLNATDILLSFDTVITVEKDFLDVFATQSEANDFLNLLNLTESRIILHVSEYDGEIVIDNKGGLVQIIIDSYADEDSGTTYVDNDLMFNYWIIDGERVKKRETDYTVIFGKNDKKAVFLNNIRASNPNNKILKYLDGRQSLLELSGAMGEVMFFNPLLLNDGLKEILTRQDFYNNSDLNRSAGIEPYISSTNLGNSFNFSYGKLDVGFYIGTAKQDSDYTYGMADVYGAMAKIHNGWFGGGVKVVSADWNDTTIMTTDGAAKNNPKSQLFYGFLDFIPNLSYFQPIVRYNYINSEIEDYEEDEQYLSYGGRFYFFDSGFGQKNDYSLYGIFGNEKLDWGIMVSTNFTDDGVMIGLRASPENLAIEMKVGF